jgi:hypothetical protein
MGNLIENSINSLKLVIKRIENEKLPNYAVKDIKKIWKDFRCNSKS